MLLDIVIDVSELLPLFNWFQIHERNEINIHQYMLKPISLFPIHYITSIWLSSHSLQCDIYDKQEDLSIMHIVSWPCSLVLVSYSNTMLQFQPYLLLSIHCQSGSTPIHISCKVTIANVHQYNCWTSRITTRLQTYYMKTFNFWSHAWGLTSSDNNIIAYLLSKNCIYGNNLAIQQKNLLSLLPYPRS